MNAIKKPEGHPNNKKVPLWLPYTKEIETKKEKVFFAYKGGEYEGDLKDIHSIMFYGGVCPLPEKFLDACRRFKIPLCIHRRNISTAIWITPSTAGGSSDLLGKQITVQNNEKKRVHIAKRILDAKFKSMEWLWRYPPHFSGTYHSIESMRRMEAHHAAHYWKRYYQSLGFGHTSRRTKGNPVTTCLDAVSKLFAGVTMRWVLYHRLSPTHGFLHEPTDYASLVYDLMEPYRGHIDQAVHKAIRDAQGNGAPEKEWVGYAIEHTEHLLDKKVYTDATRQIVTFQELIHGSVLALRAYLNGDTKRLIVPTPSTPNGGRPKKTGYRLFGRSAGPTDFWDTARSLS